ncbi:hypothetical protein J5N97_003221 [Dioscorea zingiberensis]|uniref:Uncharacterized protein n=1 Tax=Dioscorea zingiberensis TaxID=325984 RepID=A0A9D5D6A6_9LILI|nr:hypothetical protein J5N97_003221 [Dioscorea zingiberensis]
MACSSAGNRCSRSTGERKRCQSGGFLVAGWIGGKSEPPLFCSSWLKLGSFPALLNGFLVFLILRNFPVYNNNKALISYYIGRLYGLSISLSKARFYILYM